MGPVAERGLHALAAVLVTALGVAALKRWQGRKARRAHSLLPVEPGKPSIVYFHSPSCGVCRVSQKPVLDRLIARVGEDKVQLIAVDVTESTDVARAWGVTTVPSTYVLDPEGDVAHVNNGLVGEPRLLRQLSS
jgi:thiol-disulfide isomerase/thioredoxin